jgi:hypothetical protein
MVFVFFQLVIPAEPRSGERRNPWSPAGVMDSGFALTRALE